mgnify:CR=1 FL=1
MAKPTIANVAQLAGVSQLDLIEGRPLEQPFKTFPAQLIVRSTTAHLHR